MPRLLVLLLALLLSAGAAQAQYQPVVLMCGSPPAPCTASNPLPVSPASGSTTDVNITQVAGTAVKTGHGTASGALRVELPTDGTGVVGLNAGANTIGAVTQASGPWTSNITQFGSSAVVTGTGVGGAGIPRVTISSDSTLAANQSVNLAQVAGATTATGAGTAAGALRVELPTNGTGTVGLNAGSALVGKVGIDQTTPGTTNLVALIPGQNGVSANSGVMDAGTQRVVLASDGPTVTVLGTTSGAAVITDANGSIQQYLRGLVKQWTAGTLVLGTGSNVVGNVGVLQASTTSGQSGPLIQCAVTTSAPTYTTAQTDPLSCDTAGNLRVGGGIAQSLATAGQLGSMVMGAVTTSAPTYTTGNTNPLSLDTAGNLRVSGAPAAAATGGATYTHIAAGQATTTVKSGAGTLYALILNSAATATNTTTIYDNTAGSGTVIAIPAATTATIPISIGFGPTGIAFATGLTVVTAAANGSDMTFVWK